MNTPEYKEVLSALYPGDDRYDVQQLNSGLINHTYKISKGKNALLLQQINKNVFRKPIEVQDNYIKLWEYKNGSSAITFPKPVSFHSSNTLFIDSEGNYWRAFEFLDNTITLDIPKNAEQAKLTAKTFGRITAFLSGFDINSLNIVIPDFHNLSFRYQQFEDAIKSGSKERLEKATTLVEEFKSRKKYKDFYEMVVHSDEFPKRVMHHDAKIANVLFDKRTENVICAVDFDTTMPGYFFSDVGDMIRSMVCSEDEHNTDFDALYVRKDFYKEILSGYLDVMGNHLTESEKKYIHCAGLIMFYMQGLRYISDYLNNDIYYQTRYKEQNFDRAMNQMVLLKKLEDFLSEEYNFSL